jgi:hypothetical protein
MGKAPLADPLFRSAIFEQLGGAKLEGAAQETSAVRTTPTPFARRLQVLIQNGFRLGAAARLAVANGRTVLLAAQILNANFVY